MQVLLKIHMVQPVYRSSKGVFRGTAVGLQAVHFLEVQIKKWIVLEERERERDWVYFSFRVISWIPTVCWLCLLITKSQYPACFLNLQISFPKLGEPNRITPESQQYNLCFIPVPNSCRHSLGTCRPLWSEKQVG